MLTKEQASAEIASVYPGAKVEAIVLFKGFYLARVQHPDAAEQGYDPFYAVHPDNGKVAEFSIMTDGAGSLGEIAELFAAA